MKKLLIVFFVLSFGAISFAQVGQAEDLTADSSSIDVPTDTQDADDEAIEEPAEEPAEQPDPSFTQIVVDIKPGSCPNPLNVKSRGVLPVAILGTEDLDVTDIDPLTVTLAGVVPIRSSIEDVSHPWNVEGCEDYGVDGYDDLTLKFDTQEIVAALGTSIVDGDVFELPLIGTLTDNTQIEGADTVLIIKKGKK